MNRNTLSQMQFVACLEHLGFRDRFPGERFHQKVTECMGLFDKDNDGSIDRDEFLTFHNWLVLDDVLGRRRGRKKDKASKKSKKERRAKKDKAAAAEKKKAAASQRQRSSADGSTDLEAAADAAAIAIAVDDASSAASADGSGGGEDDAAAYARPLSPSLVRVHNHLESALGGSNGGGRNSKKSKQAAAAAKRRALTPIRRHPAADAAEKSAKDGGRGRLKARLSSGNIIEQAAHKLNSVGGVDGMKKAVGRNGGSTTSKNRTPSAAKKRHVDKATVKHHVKSALKAVREVLATPKGQEILAMEAKVLAARKQNRCVRE